MHLHSLVYARLVRPALSNRSGTMKNAAVFPVMLLYAVIPASLAVVFKTSTPLLMLAFVCCGFLYALSYARLVHFGWALPKLRVGTQTRRRG